MKKRFSLAIMLAAAAPAAGCPVCNTGTGEAVRSGIFDGNLGLSLLAVLLPFVVVLGVVAMIHFGFLNVTNEHGDRD